VTPPVVASLFTLLHKLNRYLPSHWHWTPAVVAAVAAAGLAVAAVIVWAVVELSNSFPMDRLMIRRVGVRYGLNQYRGKSTNPDVPAGMSVVIGRPVRRGLFGSRLARPIGASWEFCTVIYAGPRVGKSTAYVMPAIARAPGAVLATSNKRDLVDTTRLIREQRGRVWIFDPQGVVGAAQEWWWNPLRRITQVEHAHDLAKLWMETSQGANATSDAYFEPAGQQLLGSLLFAAAIDKRPVTDVFHWLTDPERAREAAAILKPRALLRDPGLDPARRAELERREQSYAATAQAVEMVIAQPDRQRAGVFATAMKAVAWMEASELRRWIEPSGGLDEFVPADFATSTDTLYSLSREGSAAVTPLVTALTADVLLTTMDTAAAMRAGRLPVPMLAALDEAANICPWKQLPRLFSFFGSAGVALLAVFQSPAQVRSTFGPDGASALHSAANVRITMGGLEDTAHLQSLEQLVGQVRTRERSHSRGPAGSGGGTRTSRQYSWRDRSAITIAQLHAMGRTRAVATLSGTAPVLVQPLPWHKDKQLTGPIRQSLARYAHVGTQPPPPERYDPRPDPKMRRR
jgi:type IV secretory pathway TraG/TraD family ATPase VirD4